jgi:hypothetical protein
VVIGIVARQSFFHQIIMMLPSLVHPLYGCKWNVTVPVGSAIMEASPVPSHSSTGLQQR